MKRPDVEAIQEDAAAMLSKPYGVLELCDYILRLENRMGKLERGIVQAHEDSKEWIEKLKPYFGVLEWIDEEVTA